MIRITGRGPILFRQERVGLHERRFVMLKFRSMRPCSDEALHREYVTTLLTSGRTEQSVQGAYKLHDDPRITAVGRVLRQWSFDELPQLLNVVRGEMSIVGPRPALPYEVDLYSDRHRRRFLVRPGITGLWQVSGRNRLTMSEMLDLDVEYVERKSLRLDLRIIAGTVPAMIRGDGAR
jgi:lipopolysaccharide/colanic/teichoic acid biosynthesis glycosyltransferase